MCPKIPEIRLEQDYSESLLLVERRARQIVAGEVPPEVGAVGIWAQWSEAGASSEPLRIPGFP